MHPSIDAIMVVATNIRKALVQKDVETSQELLTPSFPPE